MECYRRFHFRPSLISILSNTTQLRSTFVVFVFVHTDSSWEQMKQQKNERICTIPERFSSWINFNFLTANMLRWGNMENLTFSDNLHLVYNSFAA